VVGCLLCITSLCSAVTLDQVVQLSQAKTSDELIILVIQKSKPEKPVTAEDAVYLKQQGVSDSVIEYLMRISNPEKMTQPAQEGASEKISTDMRAYYTTRKDGRKIRVITNVDENGDRMGPPAPPPMEPPVYPEYKSEPVQYVEREPEPEPPSYPEYPGGMPYYSGYYPYDYYLPYYYPGSANCLNQHHGAQFHHGNGFVQRPPIQVRQPARTYTAPPAHSSFAGTSMRRRVS